MTRQKRSAPERLLTPTEVADRLLIAPVTVRLWASRGLLPSVTTPGGHRRFRPADVDAFIERRRKANASHPSRPSRVLVIDDDAQFARYLTGLLRRRVHGIEIETAPDGFAAGMKTESMRPDLVTLDLQMPGMDGFEVCRLLRTMPTRERMRIVVLTGFPSAGNIERSLAAGADACIAKTAPPKLLLRELGFPSK